MAIRSLEDLDLQIFQDQLITTAAPAQGGRDTRQIFRSPDCATIDVPVHWLYRELRQDPLTELPYISFFRRGLAQTGVPVNRVHPVYETVDANTVRVRMAPDWYNIDYQISFGSRNWEEYSDMLWDLRGKVFAMAYGTRYLDVDGISRSILLTQQADRHSRTDQIYRSDLIFTLLIPLYAIQRQEGDGDIETIQTLEINYDYFVSLGNEQEQQIETAPFS
jgi:hypothetical protein